MKVLFAIVCALGVLSLATEVTAQRRRGSRPTSRTQRSTPRVPPAKALPVLPDIRNDPDVEAADIAIIANITAEELRFDAVPNTSVEFLDKSKNQTIWQAERFNLPDKIERGVTYRNIGIRLKITSRLADIERIVAEALGEIPISENGEQPKPPPPANASGSAQQPVTSAPVTNRQKGKP
jgi:hypothetical protein